MSIRILDTGLSDTIQDAGRYGYGRLGINPGGAMDRIAVAAANYLVSNTETEGVIEMHFPAATFEFTTDALIAISGADFAPHINDRPVPVNTPLIIPASSVLQFKKINSGARTYLSVSGGLQLKPWLNSYSTNMKAKAGGYEGRALRKGDVLHFNAPVFMQTDIISKEARALSWHADITALYREGPLIRLIQGPQYDLFTECSETIICGNSFTVSHQSDRMGYRLSGSPLQAKTSKQMISSAVTRGAVQLLPNGQLIILMADHQTTGGYPIIAYVAGADLPKLSQMPANSSLRFAFIPVTEAESLLFMQHHHLQQLKNACTFRLQEYLQQHGVYRS